MFMIKCKQYVDKDMCLHGKENSNTTHQDADTEQNAAQSGKNR